MIRKRSRRIFCLLFSCLLYANAAQAAGQQAILVLDASGSMWGQIDGKSKIEMAREAVVGVLESWSPQDHLGLVVYGHRRKGDCGDIEMLIPPGPVNAHAFDAVVAKISPKGKTPLSAAVRMAAEKLKYTEEKATVILVSDGRETCDADPCALATELERTGVDFTTHVIGFDIKDETGDAQLRCLAEKTGGAYFSAGDASSLKKALSSAVKKTVEADNFYIAILPKAGAKPGSASAEWSVYRIGADGKLAKDYTAHAYTNPGYATLPAGRYLARVNLGKGTAEREFEIQAGEATKLEIVVGVGDLDITLLPKAGAKPGSASAEWSVYRIGADGKPAKEYTAHAYTNPGHATLPAGRYLARVNLGKGMAEREFEIEAGKKTKLEVVVSEK